MEPFATLIELKGRLEWTLDADEERAATGALEDLSNWARHYGRNWEADAAPLLVKTLVLGAAARFMRNPDNFTTSRDGDETVSWTDRGAQAAAQPFVESEIIALKALVRPVVFGSVGMTAWGPQRLRGADGLTPVAGESPFTEDGLVPVEGGGDPFPLFSNDEPW